MEATSTAHGDERMPLMSLGVAVFLADAELSLPTPADSMECVMLCKLVASWDAGELR
jgi:hypothetical protein